MPIRCVSPYKSNLGTFAVGETVDGPLAFEAHLLADSPGSFEVVGPQGPAAPTEPEPAAEPVTEAVESAPVDRMMKRATRKGA